MKTNLKILLYLMLFISPSLVHAHSAGATMSGWHNGFYHPLHVWDHLLTMLAVGIWLAQLRGRTVWQLPLVFVGMMSLGGLVGVTGISIPGVELMILLSVAVFVVLVAVESVSGQPSAYLS